MSNENTSEDRSSYESSLFKFKRKEANRAASLCLLGGLAAGLFIGFAACFYKAGLPGSIVAFMYLLWARPILFGLMFGGLVGYGIGFAVGTKMDLKKRRKKKKSSSSARNNE